MKPKLKSASKQNMADITHIKDLKPDQRNARKHNARNIGMIEDALNEVGAARSIVIDEDGNILAGNGTVEAAAQAGIERVKVVEASGEEIVAVRRRGLTEKQKRRLALFDNRTAELAEWEIDVVREIVAEDAEALKGMFGEDEFAQLLARNSAESTVDVEPQVDRRDELREKWGVKVGDLWLIGEHRLLCGDSTKAADVARLLGDRKPVLMVTDPPYGVEYDAGWRVGALQGNKQVGTAVGKVTNDDRADWREAWALFPGDVAYVWHAGVASPVVADSLTACGFERRALIVWAKHQLVIGRGHYHHQHEPCWYCVRKGATGHWAGDRKQTTLWQIDKPRKSETGHSTQKPVECMARPMRNHHSQEIYDPFCGSGTSIIAAEQLGRKCYAIEIEPGYVAVILQRYLDATGKRPIASQPVP